MYLSNFMAGYSGWPKKPVYKPMSYSAVKGLTTLSGQYLSSSIT